MTFTKIAVIGGVVVFGLVCWMAVAGFGAAREGVISLVALVLLVAGGNWLGRGYPSHRSYSSQQAAPSDAGGAPVAPSADAPSDEPGA